MYVFTLSFEKKLWNELSVHSAREKMLIFIHTMCYSVKKSHIYDMCGNS